MKERLDAIRTEMLELEGLRLSDSAAAARFSALAVEGAEIVNAKAEEIAKRFNRRARTVSAKRFEMTYSIGLR